MTRWYFVSERFSWGNGGSGCRASGRRRTRRPVTRNRAARCHGPTRRRHRGRRALVDQPVLHLVGRIGTPAAPVPRRARVSKLVSPTSRIFPAACSDTSSSAHVDVARHVIVPPVELHEIEALDTEARERAVDRADDVVAWTRRARPIGDHFVCTCTARRCWPAAEKPADQRLDAGVDVRTVERRDARVDEAAMSSRAVRSSTGPWPPASCQPPLMSRRPCSRARARRGDTHRFPAPRVPTRLPGGGGRPPPSPPAAQPSRRRDGRSTSPCG